MREPVHPRHDDRVDAVTDCPLKPVLGARLAHRDGRHTVKRVRLDVVTHTVRRHVAGEYDDRTLAVGTYRQCHIAEAAVVCFEQRVKHVLDRLRCLGELIEHDDYGLTRLQLKRSVGEILGHPRLAVHARHGNVAKVLLRTVEVGICVAVAEVGLERRHDARLADARLPAQEEPIAGAGLDEGGRFLEGHGEAEVECSHCVCSLVANCG